MSKKILSLGQCGVDNYAITQILESTFGVEVSAVATFPEALAKLRADRFALVLVNRILDANGASGLAFISQLKEDAALTEIPVMLVSNYPDAQQQAVARGAMAGFGKGALCDAKTLDRLRAILGEAAPTE